MRRIRLSPTGFLDPRMPRPIRRRHRDLHGHAGRHRRRRLVQPATAFGRCFRRRAFFDRAAVGFGHRDIDRGHRKIVVRPDRNRVADATRIRAEVYLVHRRRVEACPEFIEGKSAIVRLKTGCPFGVKSEGGRMKAED